MGDAERWKVKQESERIYSLPEMSEEDGMKVAELESIFAEMDGYTAESRAEEILIQAGIEQEFHYGLMANVAPGADGIQRPPCPVGTRHRDPGPAEDQHCPQYRQRP